MKTRSIDINYLICSLRLSERRICSKLVRPVIVCSACDRLWRHSNLWLLYNVCVLGQHGI